MSNSFNIRLTHFSCGDDNFSMGGFAPPVYGPVDFCTSQKQAFSWVHYMCILNSCVV